MTEPSGLSVDAPERDRLYRVLADVIERHWAEVRSLPVQPEAWEVTAVRALDFEQPHELEALVTEVAGWLRDGTVHTASPRYFGLFNPTPTFAGVLADALVAAYNPQLAVESHAPAAVAMERHLLAFLAQAFGLDGWAGHFTTGGAEANLTAVATALTAAFPHAGDEGLRSLDRQPVVYASSQAHHALLKIAHVSGIGRSGLRLLDPDDQLRLRGDTLRDAIRRDRARGRAPFLVFATVGSTASGTIDPIAEIADVCDELGVALHVDAAWAGAGALSDRLKPQLGDFSRARSVTVDAHKWMSVPMGAGMFFTRDTASLNNTFGAETNYMPSAELGDPYLTSLQWSRRHIGLKVVLSLAAAGRSGYANQIDRDCALGDELRRRLVEAGWSIANQTPLPVVCFTRPDLTSASDYADVADAVNGSGDAWISVADLDGRPALRACITSYRTTSADVAALVDLLPAPDR